MKPTRKHRTTLLVSALCRVCPKTWDGANAQACAARHCDATGHATRVDSRMVVDYGEEADGMQRGLFDGVTVSDELARANRGDQARIVDAECVKALEATSEIALPDYPAGGTPWL